MADGDTSGRLVVRTKTELIRDRLEAQIIEGQLEPGARIVLDELARELGVSKIPIREALSSLESQGLVVQSPHSGPRVAPLSLREFQAIYLLREEVEALVARLAATKIDDAELTRMREINARMRAMLGSGDGAALADLNTQFHLAIAKATTYQSLVDAVTQSLRSVRRYRAVIDKLATNWPAAVDEHDKVLTALESRDPVRVEKAVRGHVRSQRQSEVTTDDTETD
ncbi:DNA-binding GntR family transcriptional regulator [Kribbella aluminosa]|uniref:DNA-binding GntR family transcriptional regulator n=1 Tax=Kribbella aluminosa TaxID=416017 RepID=A0ABS4UX29_9ACTN|nr:GntR family transcriptional regulator [Kribbella aluminosa]MBP2356190.1 DNA-binding GntR family transcriptional regulator [Kribbella aluminosa]